MRVQSKMSVLRVLPPRSNKAASAGESVSALNSEMAIEKAMVRENCR